MKVKFFLGIIILFQLISSCKTEPATNAAVPTDILNIRYAEHPDNTFDVYLPAKRNGNTRTVILLHGGFWLEGDKSDMTEYAEFLRDQGFACVTMNYRLTNTPENNFHPAQVNDVGKVIDYVTTKAIDWHVSPGRFGLLGYSAGGHIALLYTYASNTNGKVKTVVSIAGPSNLADSAGVAPAVVPIVTKLIGLPIKNNLSVYQQASPVFHISATSKPTFLVHGKADKIVPYKQSVDLQAKLQQFNVKTELRLYDKAGHDFADPAIVDSLFTEVAAWFDQNLR